MKQKQIVLVVIAVFLIFVLWWCNHKSKTENLSLSQFPVPTCSTCKSCQFYTCGGCGTIYQEQNKADGPCNCGGFTTYKTKMGNTCYDKFLRGIPQPAAIEGFCGCGSPTTPSGAKPPVKGSCTNCSGDPICLQHAGTFDSGSTFLRNLPCPVSFPRIPHTTRVVDSKEMRKTSLLDVYRTLEAGGFIIGAKDEKVAEYTLGKLQELTNNGCANGYPDFYYINGPVVVMTKVGDTYYWMYGNPISYIPETYGNFVNESKNWKLAQTAYQRAIKRLNGESPIFFYGH